MIPDQFVTHVVENQPVALQDYNSWLTDSALRENVARQGGMWAQAHLREFGAAAGGELMTLGFTANENKPRLRAFDRFGRRIDEVEFHPAYHELMERCMAYGTHSFAWRNADKAGAHVARSALGYMAGQAEAGTGCPLTMTYAGVPVVRRAPELAAWIPKLTSYEYDARTLPALEKKGCTIGMGMTEKQGGSDVRSNTTRAHRQADGSYRLVGHKWFFSAPMCDAHLVLAQTDEGVTCFLLPRMLPDGSNNAVRIQRLKEKLGDWSNASSEVEFQGAWARRVGDEGRGVATILEMVALTRLDCMTGSAATMRQALVQALHHTRQRVAFGKKLVDHALMQNVLADLALESEAAVALTFRVARAVDGATRGDAHDTAFARIATAIGKYWICKRCPPFVNEAQECLGGNGYVEESILPRLYRQAPLNSIWEGSGNVQCLDVLRALRKEPDTREALFAELALARGQNEHLDRELGWLATAFDDVASLERRSRYLVERTALALQAGLLLQSGNDAIANAFCESRLGREHGLAFGTLTTDAPLRALIDRATVQV